MTALVAGLVFAGWIVLLATVVDWTPRRRLEREAADFAAWEAEYTHPAGRLAAQRPTPGTQASPEPHSGSQPPKEQR